MILQKNYRATLTEELLATTSGEIEIKLSITPASDTGYVLIEPGVSGKEESSFYHRKSGNSVFVYGVNRDNPTTHDINVSVMLTNSVDSLNYILGFINESKYIYKKDLQNLVIIGGKFSIDKTTFTISNLDTSLGLTNKVLVPNNTNYVYVKDNDYYITITEDLEQYLVATVIVDASGNITSITKEKVDYIPGLNFTQEERELIQSLNMAEIYLDDGIPNVLLGINGDIYIDRLNANVYKKISGSWVFQFNIKGTPGTDGEDGIDGKTLLNGEIDPTTQGVDGDFYINTNTWEIFGPKATTWGEGKSLIGLTGNGINSFVLHSTAGKTKTYRITFTNATYYDIVITDGADGAGGDMYSVNNLSDVASIETSRNNLEVSKRFTLSTITTNVNPAVPYTTYLVNATDNNITITLPDVILGNTDEFRIILKQDTHKIIITTVGGTQLIGGSTIQNIQTVNGQLYIKANGINGYDIITDSREYYRIIDIIGSGTTDLSDSGYESGSIYHIEPGVGSTRTIIIPDSSTQCVGNFCKFLLDGEGDVLIKTENSESISGQVEQLITSGGFEITCFGDHYGITQDSRPKATNVSLSLYSLTESSDIVDPAGGFYRQTCVTKSDVRYNNVTGILVTSPTITGNDIYLGGVISDEGVPIGIIPEGPIVTYATVLKASGLADFNFYIKFYKYINGVETFIGQSGVSQTITSDIESDYFITASLPETDFGTNGRLIRKIYANKVGTATSPVAQYYVEGPNPSYSVISINTGNISHNMTAGIQQAGAGVIHGHINNQAQKIYGKKEFDEYPKGPGTTPTEDYELVDKLYVDNNSPTQIFIAGEDLVENDFFRYGNTSNILIENILNNGGSNLQIAYTAAEYEKGQGILNNGKVIKNIGLSLYKTGTGGDTVLNCEIFSDAGFANLLATSSNSINASSIRAIDYSTSAIGTNLRGLFFTEDGLKSFIGDFGNKLHQYSLTESMNLGTMSLTKSLRFGFYDTSQTDLTLSEDGLNLYVIGGNQFAGYIYQYRLATAWDLSTAYGLFKEFDLRVGTGTGGSFQGIRFNSNGTKLYGCVNTNVVYQYTLSTAWDISTASYDNVSKSVVSEAITPSGLDFNSDGTKMYVSGYSSDKIHQYTLSTGWDLSTATYDNKFLSVSTQATVHNGMALSRDGTKAYITYNGTIYQYNLSTAWDISTGVYYGNKNVGTQDTATYGLYIPPTGTDKIFVLGQGYGVFRYSFVTAGNITTLSYDTNTYNSKGEYSVTGHSFNSYGTKLYVYENNNKKIYEYSLGTAYNLSTIVNNNISFYIGTSQDNILYYLNFSPDGTKMYLFGNTNKYIFQYTLSTAWDISTITYASKSFLTSTQDSNVKDFIFSTDGTKLYTLGDTNNTIYQYTLSTAFDISTANYNTQTGSQDTSPAGFFIESNGRRLWILGTNQQKIQSMGLSTIWNISTASITNYQKTIFNFGNLLLYGTFYFKLNIVSGTYNATNYINWYCSLSSTYAGGNMYDINNVGAILNQSTRDAGFEINYGYDTSYEEISKVYKSKAINSGNSYILGVISEGGLLGETVKGVLSGMKGGFSSLLTNSKKYYLTDAGGISQTHGTIIQQVGVAVSDSVLLIEKTLKRGMVSITRDPAAVSGTVTYTHNLGFIPRSITMHSFCNASTNSIHTECYGMYYNQLQYYSLGSYYGAGSGNGYISIGKTTQTSQTSGYISNITENSFDIVWTLSGTPGAGFTLSAIVSLFE